MGENVWTPPGNPRLYRIRFDDDSRLAGLELVVEGSTVGEMQAFLAAVGRLDTRDGGRWAITEVAELMAAKLVSWNHSELEAGLAGLLSFEFADLYEIMKGYGAAVVGVAAPLDGPSDAGEPSAEESTEMEMSLASLSN